MLTVLDVYYNQILLFDIIPDVIPLYIQVDLSVSQCTKLRRYATLTNALICFHDPSVLRFSPDNDFSREDFSSPTFSHQHLANSRTYP